MSDYIGMGHYFCRELYKSIKADYFPKDAKIKDIWTYKTMGGYEVHGPNDRYWFGRVCCAWEAKAKAIWEWFGEEVTA